MTESKDSKIYEKAKERFDKEFNSILSLVREHPFMSNLEVTIPGLEQPILLFGNPESPSQEFDSLRLINSYDKANAYQLSLTNFEELMVKTVDSYYREIVQQMLDKWEESKVAPEKPLVPKIVVRPKPVDPSTAFGEPVHNLENFISFFALPKGMNRMHGRVLNHLLREFPLDTKLEIIAGEIVSMKGAGEFTRNRFKEYRNEYNTYYQNLAKRIEP